MKEPWYSRERETNELAASADQVPLGAIVSATDGAEFRDSCVLGLPECDNQNPCPLHEQWKGVRASVTSMLDETSLADLARVTKARRRRLGPACLSRGLVG